MKPVFVALPLVMACVAGCFTPLEEALICRGDGDCLNAERCVSGRCLLDVSDEPEMGVPDMDLLDMSAPEMGVLDMSATDMLVADQSSDPPRDAAPDAIMAGGCVVDEDCESRQRCINEWCGPIPDPPTGAIERVLEVFVYDKDSLNREPVRGAVICIFEEQPGLSTSGMLGLDGTIRQVKTGHDGRAKIAVRRDLAFVLYAARLAMEPRFEEGGRELDEESGVHEQPLSRCGAQCQQNTYSCVEDFE
jgi:hypothetical protein